MAPSQEDLKSIKILLPNIQTGKGIVGGELRGQLWVPREVELRQKSGQLESGPAFQSFIFTQTARADSPSLSVGMESK